MILDVEKYISHLDELDVSRARKEEMIRTVWGLMESQVDKAFGKHPVQAIYAKNEKTISLQGVKSLDSMGATITDQFNGPKGTNN